jgi:Holliday junction resolvase RusA-like endonuclease
MKLVIPGRPATKKNSSRIVKFGKRTSLIPSEAFEKYQVEALWHLKKYKQKFEGPVQVCCLYWLPNKQWWPDLIGLLQATSDILEKAGIIENDKFIANYDGSRIVGLDKVNPRVEIFIEAV